jgi:TRAP-type C4-dicarboxylate transport system substrate-binding protein
MAHLRKAVMAAPLLCVALPAAAEEWNVSLWGSPREFTAHVERLAELVAERSDGEFTLNISYGGLSPSRENLDGISIGAFEMAQFCAGYHPDKNPVITVLELPFLGVETLEEERAVSEAVYAHPAAAEDMARWNAKLLMPTPMPQYNLVGSGEPRLTVDSFEGMRVRATGGLGRAFEQVGAVPTSVSATEVFNAMQSGVVSTVAFAPHAHLSFRTVDRAEWWTTNLNPGTVSCPVVVSVDAYEGLSDEHRAILDEAVPDALDHYLERYAELMARWDGVLEESGIEPVSVDPAEVAAFRDRAAEPVLEAWLADMEAQGIPGQELYDLVQATLAETRAAAAD